MATYPANGSIGLEVGLVSLLEFFFDAQRKQALRSSARGTDGRVVTSPGVDILIHNFVAGALPTAIDPFKGRTT
jgi:hypothetical protein